MCLPIRRRDRKSRAWFVIANLSLSVGLILWLFVRPALPAQRDWLDGICGLLMGVSIAMNLGRLCARLEFESAV